MSHHVSGFDPRYRKERGGCQARHEGNNNGCPWPIVESSDSNLCARHLLIAYYDVIAIGDDMLMEIVKQEQRQAVNA